MQQRFVAQLDKEEDGGFFFELPFDVKATFGRARPPVRVSINGYSYRTTVFVYSGRSVIGVRREHREKAGIAPGARIQVTLTLDDKPRIVKAPADLAAALKKSPAAKKAWDKLSYTHKKEWADAIRDAMRPETRARRIESALAALRSK